MEAVLLFAFVAGVLTILAPCTLPVIPVVLGGAAGTGRRRVAGIFVGFGATFMTLTILVASTLAALGITTDVLRASAAVVVGLVGATLAVPAMSRVAERIIPGSSVMSGPGMTAPSGADGFWRGVIVGAAIGLIWAPCVGPLMAAVIATAVVDGPALDGALVALAYVLGAIVPLAIIAILGRRALRRIDPRGADRLRRLLGVAMIAVSVLVLTGQDIPLQTQLATAFAGGAGEPTRATNGELDIDPTNLPLDDFGLAPEVTGISAWINSPPLSLAGLRGKVVLVHFWTFACVNCRNVQPYVKAWYDRYEDDGFVVLSVHTPELSFERDLNNVREAVSTADVRYPVAVDPDFATWRAFENGAWPAFHFIDKRGHIRYRYGGEGGYETSEAVIQALLAETGT